jgi:hypothetical protein
MKQVDYRPEGHSPFPTIVIDIRDHQMIESTEVTGGFGSLSCVAFEVNQTCPLEPVGLSDGRVALLSPSSNSMVIVPAF